MKGVGYPKMKEIFINTFSQNNKRQLRIIHLQHSEYYESSFSYLLTFERCEGGRS